MGGARAGGGDGRASEGYDPTRRGYHPVDHACWKRGEKYNTDTHTNTHVLSILRVPYLAIAKTFEKIEEESKRYIQSLIVVFTNCLSVWCTMCRLKIIATLTNLFRSVIALSPDELVKCIYLCLNKV